MKNATNTNITSEREYNTFTMRVIHDILGYDFKFISLEFFLPISFYALTNGLFKL